jgi:hypothetical protein
VAVPTLRQLLAVGLALLAVGAGAVVVVFLPSSSCNACPGCGPSGNTPLGSGFALTSAVARGGATNHSYLIGVNPSGGVRWGEFRVNVTDSSGTTMAPASDWTVRAYNSTGATGDAIAAYSFASASWTLGSSVLITSGQSLSLELGQSNLVGQGDSFVLIGGIGPCSHSGEVSVSLP